MNYYLMINNYPPLVVYSETKDQYYKALDHYDNTGDITPFLNYMKKEFGENMGFRPTSISQKHSARFAFGTVK